MRIARAPLHNCFSGFQRNAVFTGGGQRPRLWKKRRLLDFHCISPEKSGTFLAATTVEQRCQKGNPISTSDKEGAAAEAQFRESKICVPAADGGFIVVAGGRRQPQKRPGCDTCPDAEGDSSHRDFGVSSCYRPVQSLHPERLHRIVPQHKWTGE